MNTMYNLLCFGPNRGRTENSGGKCKGSVTTPDKRRARDWALSSAHLAHYRSRSKKAPFEWALNQPNGHRPSRYILRGLIYCIASSGSMALETMVGPCSLRLYIYHIVSTSTSVPTVFFPPLGASPSSSRHQTCPPAHQPISYIPLLLCPILL